MKPRLKSMGRRFLLTPLFRLMGTSLVITIIYYIPSIYRHGTLTQSNGSLILPLKLLYILLIALLNIHLSLLSMEPRPKSIGRRFLLHSPFYFLNSGKAIVSETPTHNQESRAPPPSCASSHCIIN